MSYGQAITIGQPMYECLGGVLTEDVKTQFEHKAYLFYFCLPRSKDVPMQVLEEISYHEGTYICYEVHGVK